MREGWLCPRCNTVHSPDMKKCLQCDPSLTVDTGPIVSHDEILGEMRGFATAVKCPICRMYHSSDIPHDCEEAKPYGVRMPFTTSKCYICGMTHEVGAPCPDVTIN